MKHIKALQDKINQHDQNFYALQSSLSKLTLIENKLLVNEEKVNNCVKMFKLFQNLVDTREQEKLDLEAKVNALKDQMEHVHYLIVSSSNKITQTQTLNSKQASSFADAKGSSFNLARFDNVK